MLLKRPIHRSEAWHPTLFGMVVCDEFLGSLVEAGGKPASNLKLSEVRFELWFAHRGGLWLGDGGLECSGVAIWYTLPKLRACCGTLPRLSKICIIENLKIDRVTLLSCWLFKIANVVKLNIEADARG